MASAHPSEALKAKSELWTAPLYSAGANSPGRCLLCCALVVEDGPLWRRRQVMVRSQLHNTHTRMWLPGVLVVCWAAEFARRMDEEDELHGFRDRFVFPKASKASFERVCVLCLDSDIFRSAPFAELAGA